VTVRGVTRVVSAREMEVGRFYLEASQGSEPTLFQCIQTAIPFEGSTKQMALVYSLDGMPNLAIHDINWYETLVEMPNVSVRVDPPSISGTGTTTSLRMNTLIVIGSEAVINVPVGSRGWQSININTGRTIEQAIRREWVSFARWSLVVDEAGEEITIASFGGA